MSTHLLDGTVHHVDEEQSDSLVVHVLYFAIVLVNVALDSCPERRKGEREREEGRAGGRKREREEGSIEGFYWHTTQSPDDWNCLLCSILSKIIPRHPKMSLSTFTEKQQWSVLYTSCISKHLPPSLPHVSTPHSPGWLSQMPS